MVLFQFIAIYFLHNYLFILYMYCKEFVPFFMLKAQPTIDIFETARGIFCCLIMSKVVSQLKNNNIQSYHTLFAMAEKRVQLKLVIVFSTFVITDKKDFNRVSSRKLHSITLLHKTFLNTFFCGFRGKLVFFLFNTKEGSFIRFL